MPCRPLLRRSGFPSRSRTTLSTALPDPVLSFFSASPPLLLLFTFYSFASRPLALPLPLPPPTLPLLLLPPASLSASFPSLPLPLRPCAFSCLAAELFSPSHSPFSAARYPRATRALNRADSNPRPRTAHSSPSSSSDRRQHQNPRRRLPRSAFRTICCRFRSTRLDRTFGFALIRSILTTHRRDTLLSWLDLRLCRIRSGDAIQFELSPAFTIRRRSDHTSRDTIRHPPLAGHGVASLYRASPIPPGQALPTFLGTRGSNPNRCYTT